jgi:ElaA protein
VDLPTDATPGATLDASPTVVSRAFDELTVRELHDVLRLRCDVFVVEQDCAYHELDGRDPEPGTGHHWIEVEGAVAVYARTLTEPGGATRIGRVVTAPAHRGAGLAAALVGHLVERFGDGELVLDAQSHLATWYERLGFGITGDEFVEDGIPHVPMRLVSRR